MPLLLACVFTSNKHGQVMPFPKFSIPLDLSLWRLRQLLPVAADMALALDFISLLRRSYKRRGYEKKTKTDLGLAQS